MSNATEDSVTEELAERTEADQSAQSVQTPESDLEAVHTREDAAQHRNYRKTRRGYVTSDKMDKTIVVLVEDRVKHSLYGKVLRRSTKMKAHDEHNVAGVGDLVLIAETRPLSATKRWRLVEILEKAK